MVNEVKKYYLKEFTYFDGECDITFNIIGINFENQTIDIAVTNRGKISVLEYDLFKDNNGNFYFEFGVMLDKIHIQNFED